MELGAGQKGFNAARKDTISVLYFSWRGGSTVGYWIDHVLENIRQPDSGGGVVSGSDLTCTIAAGARLVPSQTAVIDAGPDNRVWPLAGWRQPLLPDTLLPIRPRCGVPIRVLLCRRKSRPQCAVHNQRPENPYDAWRSGDTRYLVRGHARHVVLCVGLMASNLLEQPSGPLDGQHPGKATRRCVWWPWRRCNRGPIH